MRNSENNIKMNLKRYNVWGSDPVSCDRENTDKLSRSTKGGEYDSDPLLHGIPVRAIKGIQGSGGITPLILILSTKFC